MTAIVMDYDGIHERAERWIERSDEAKPRINTLAARIAAGHEKVAAALAEGKSVEFCAPAAAKLIELEDELAKMQADSLAPFYVARGLAFLADQLAEIELPKGSEVTVTIPDVLAWQVKLGMDKIPF